MPGFSGNGGPAVSAALAPFTPAIAADAAGNTYVVDNWSNTIRKIDTAGNITNFAGGGGSTAEGIPATSASLSNVWGVAVDSAGNVYESEAGNSRVRKIDSTGT